MAQLTKLRHEIERVCRERHLCYTADEGELGFEWAEKVLQLYQVRHIITFCSFSHVIM